MKIIRTFTPAFKRILFNYKGTDSFSSMYTNEVGIYRTFLCRECRSGASGTACTDGEDLLQVSGTACTDGEDLLRVFGTACTDGENSNPPRKMGLERGPILM